ncbi:unnamed protein product [Cuscuta campestris]|uniref:Uncharacterized protein n=2 Tax=Cuscuta sect. Cleistogrammica TaxID=1824901 RepID=A0A484MD22_9ASTE|nr:hypothetical protein DM860_017680 [Cuscuta australis]VFQ86680.1 unnamed protein product [Cuscuta campestris]
MYDPRHLLDPHDAGSGRFGGDGTDPQSWLSGGVPSPPPTSPPRRADSSFSAASFAAAANVDPSIFNELVEMVPLVMSLIDQKPNTSFTRKGSVIYTKTPSRDSLYKKASEPNGRNTTQKISRRKENRSVGSNLDGCGDLSSRSSLSENEREELLALRKQVEDLQRQVLEKDELLKEFEDSKIEMASFHSKLDEIQKELAKKDSLLESTQIQLSDVKVKLADKQAAVEKLEWEATTSIKKAEKLEKDLEEVMKFVGELTKSNTTYAEDDYDVGYLWGDQPKQMEDLNETEMRKLEAAQEAYVAALAANREREDDLSIAEALAARKPMQSLLLLL